MRRRMQTILILLVLVGVVPLCARLFGLQIVQYETYQQKAVDQQTRDTIITPARGTIYDRNGKTLAQSVTVETVYLSPLEMENQKEDPEVIATGLSELLGVDYDTVLEKATKTNTQYQVIKKGIDKELADQVRAFKQENDIRSVQLVEDTKREYPYGNFCSHVLGFVGTDNQGLYGIEAMYDNVLTGTPGRVVSTKDAQNSDMPFDFEQYIDAENGTSLKLTIDEVIQHFLEQELQTALEENQLSGKAMGIVMNVNTGEILAMAIKGDFDPNSPFEITDLEEQTKLDTLSGEEYKTERTEYLESEWRNRLISDTYEPGSVFKAFTASMALDENVVSLTDEFFCSGYLQVGKWRIGCWKTAGHGHETFLEGLQNSCNPVFMTVAARMGRTLFHQYQVAFGFDEKTGIDLPGETSGLLHSEADLNDAELATSAFGQTFKVTPIEMVTALCSLANGGTLYQPYLVKAQLDDDGNVVKSYEPVAKRQVISEKTSETISMMMETVVSKGTGKNAYVKGFRIAGKTGTSEKIDVKTATGETDATKRIASFGAFAPADDPQVACLIILDEPANPSQGGGAIAAPVAGRLLENVLNYLGVTPQYTAEEQATLDVTVPGVVNLSVEEAKRIIGENNLKVVVKGDGDTVVAQLPIAQAHTPASSSVFLYTEGTQIDEVTTVPNVIGMTPAQANQALGAALLNIGYSGAQQSGTVYAATQSPAAGTQVEPGTVITVELRSGDVGDDVFSAYSPG